MALSSDPGNLDPQMAAGSALFTMSQLAYDSLVSVNAESGAIESQLATDWTVDGTKVTFTLADGVTCADGSELTPTVVADNIAFVGDPKNQSPFLGTFLPVGATAKADDAAGTVTLKLAAPAPFVLNGLASLPIVCQAGLDDRKSLAQGTAGTGPYELTEAAPGEQYTYQVRDGYTWGPNGATTATEGMPATVVMKIVAERDDLGQPVAVRRPQRRVDHRPGRRAPGPGRPVLRRDPGAAGRAVVQPRRRPGDERPGRPDGADPGPRPRRSCRTCSTSGKGTPATTLTTLEPTACPGDSVSGSVPATDTEAAKAVLDAAGPLELTFLYSTGGGSGVAAAAELAVQQWEAARHQGDGQGPGRHRPPGDHLRRR